MDFGLLVTEKRRCGPLRSWNAKTNIKAFEEIRMEHYRGARLGSGRRVNRKIRQETHSSQQVANHPPVAVVDQLATAEGAF